MALDSKVVNCFLAWCIFLVHRGCTITKLPITVDAELLEEVLRLAKARTKREASEQALKECVRHHRLQELQALAGSALAEMDLVERRQWRQSSIEPP
jgi:Arc/MetJ family transcription regulator